MIQHYFSNAPWLHIAVAGIAYFALGAIWYTPAVFGKYWAVQHNIQMTEETKKRMPMLMVSTFLLTITLALAMGLLLHLMQAPGTCMSGIKAGLFVGGAFCALPVGINYLYTAKPIKLWFIDAGYHVAGLTLTGIILSVWH